MFYLHVRAGVGAAAFATIGPYRSQEDAEAAAVFARLKHWSVVRHDDSLLRLF